MSSLTKIDSFGLVLPDQWTAIPTELGASEQFCNRARARWRESSQWDRALERRAETMFARLRHELARSGIVLAAVYMDEVVDDTAQQPQDVPEVLMAACTLGVYTKSDLETKLSLSLPVLFSAFAKRPRGEEPRFGRITDLERPGMIDLPAGRSVHLRRLYEPWHFGMQLDDYFAESYILPIGDDGESCCVLQFATTNIGQSTQFSELFNAIARTFRLFEPDQPTDFS